MGLYDSWNLDQEMLKKILLGIVGILVLIAVVWIAVSIAQPNALQVRLNGPIDLTINSAGFPIKPNAELTIILTNPELATVHNVTVFVQPQDAKALILFPETSTIETLDKSRTLLVSVRPNPNESILSGTYLVNVSTTINNKTFSQQIEVEVKNPAA